MGRLHGAEIGGLRELVLSPVTRVGRGYENELQLSDGRVSHFHAVIAWASPGVWEVRDLGSSNGTYVDGRRLDPRERRALRRGAVLGFGESTERWRLVDDARPSPEAWDLATGERTVGTTHLLTLAPAQVDGEEGPTDVLEEADGHWVLDRAGQVVDLRNGETVRIGGRRYRIVLPLPLGETEESGALVARGDPMIGTTLTFFVSADLESVGLRVEWAEGRWETSKAYARALLVLAETRRNDAARPDIAAHERGWIYVDEVCTLADYDGVGRLNVEVHRARADFARQGVPGAPTIVQRRRGTGQIRIGTDRVVLVEGALRRS